MVTGNENIFENIDEALAYLQIQEQKALKADPMRQQPPMVVRPYRDMFLSPASTNVPIVPIDSLDYPLTAFYNDIGDDKFVMTRLASGRYSLKPNLCHRKYLFRGETEFHSPCKPNLCRNPKQKRFTKELMMGQELILLMLSHPLVQLLDLGVELNGTVYQFEMNLYGLTQHYYNKTTLLDLTSNPEVAAFFATSAYDEVNDTYVPIEDCNHKPGILYYYSLDIRQDFGKRDDGTKSPLSTIGLQVFPRSERQRGFLYDQSPHENFNDVPQVNAVLFKHNADIAKRIHRQFNGGKCLFPDDILTQHWKEYCSGNNTISNRTIQLNLMNNQKMTLEQVRQEAIDLDLEIEDYIPKFTDAELDVYYDSVWKHDFWTEFCNKIHIPGDKTGRMKQDLLDLPNNPNYRWAFTPGSNHIINYNQGCLLRLYRNILQ